MKLKSRIKSITSLKLINLDQNKQYKTNFATLTQTYSLIGFTVSLEKLSRHQNVALKQYFSS